jgi:hypothetical protein
MWRFLGAATSFCLCVSLSRSARAVEPSGAVLGGLAVSDSPWGVGVRAGASIERLYLGGVFMHHPPPWLQKSNGWFWYGGLEGGFETGTMPITRVYVGAGLSRWKQSDEDAALGIEDRLRQPKDSLLLWPGVAFLFPIEPAFVGFDARFLIWMRGDAAYLPFAPALLVTGGIKL